MLLMPIKQQQVKLFCYAVSGKRVLEVGSGVSPLCCLAALRHCSKYVATDGSRLALQGLSRNLDLNSRCFGPAAHSSCCFWPLQSLRLHKLYAMHSTHVGQLLMQTAHLMLKCVSLVRALVAVGW